MSNDNVVIVKGRHLCVLREEVVAVDDVKPGHIVDYLTSGANKGKIDHAAADSPGCTIVHDRPIFNKKVTDAYGADQQVMVAEVAIGAEFVGYVNKNAALVKGATLVVAANGELTDGTDGDKVVCRLLEDHTASSSGTRRLVRRIR